ncbi:MAG: DUF3426 domain-containing protein [Methylococcales bacterium]
MAKKTPAKTVVQCPRCQASTSHKPKPKQRRKKNRTLRCHQCGLDLSPYLEIGTPLDHIHPVSQPSTPGNDTLKPPTTSKDPTIEEDNPYPTQKTPAKPSLLSSFLYTTGCVLLLIALLFQVVSPKKDSLLENPQIYPVALKASQYLDIDLPHFRNPSKIKIVSRDLSQQNKGHLELALILANKAGLPQPLPVITVKLYKFNGANLAQRSFKPVEYLPSTDLSLQMEVNQTIKIRFPFLAPGNDTPVGGFTIALS